ncbi:uncharacterized protein LOC134820327 [Bolinopsis microptera]|uniref:uncharacterized protein LOC134820327 n=1 Tax=Bolinopsis microptera TaxID=2820187 RepID=UPI00307A4F1B
MSNKRSLHMFQQGSPKRRKSSQGDTNHHKYPDTNPQYTNYQQPYQNNNFQSTNQKNEDRKFYQVAGGVNCNDLQGVYQPPTNNFGYNPGQDISAPNHRVPIQNMPAHTVGIPPQYSAQGGGTPGKTYSYKDDNRYNMGKTTNQTLSYNGANSYQYPDSKPQVMNNLQNSSRSSENSALYNLNHVIPQQSRDQLGHVIPQQCNPVAPGQYHGPEIRFYNHQPSVQYQLSDNMQTSRSNLPQQFPQLSHQQLPQKASHNSWDPSVSHPTLEHRLPTTDPGLGPIEGPLRYNPLPTTQYKIGPGVQQRNASKNIHGDGKTESKTGDKRKSSGPDSGKLNSGKKRIVTCNISALLHWSKLKYSTQFMFELFVSLSSVERRSDVSYKLELRDNEKNRLNADYYLSSTAQPELMNGKYYRVIGKMTNNTFHCFKLKEVPYMETTNANSLIKQSEIAMSKLILQINEN